MADGIASALSSLAHGAFGAGKKAAELTQRVVSPELTRTASACQLASALNDALAKEIGELVRERQYTQAQKVINASTQVETLEKALGCST